MLNPLNKGFTALKTIGASLKKTPPPQHYITCNFCSRLQKLKFELPEILIKPQVYLKYIRTKTTIFEDIPEDYVRQIYNAIYTQPITWQALSNKEWIRKSWCSEVEGSGDQFYCYRTVIQINTTNSEGMVSQNEVTLFLRINDFPEEPLYTVVYEDIELVHANDFPQNWCSTKAQK